MATPTAVKECMQKVFKLATGCHYDSAAELLDGLVAHGFASCFTLDEQDAIRTNLELAVLCMHCKVSTHDCFAVVKTVVSNVYAREMIFASRLLNGHGDVGELAVLPALVLWQVGKVLQSWL